MNAFLSRLYYFIFVMVEFLVRYMGKKGSICLTHITARFNKITGILFYIDGIKEITCYRILIYQKEIFFF